MEFRILGLLEVWDEGGEVSLGGPKPRALLAVLLLHPNEVVPADRLIDELWGEDSPERATAALRVNVSRLRKALPQELLTTRRTSPTSASRKRRSPGSRRSGWQQPSFASRLWPECSWSRCGWAGRCARRPLEQVDGSR
jgi:Transcriptional regulatory protein, C terminal